MTVATTGVTREFAERLSAEYPRFRYEISAHGILELDAIPPKNRHGGLVGALLGWLTATYGRRRVSGETGISTSRSNPEAYRQVDIALFHGAYDPDVVYNDPASIALVVEVLSPSTEEIDKVEKFEEYAGAGIPNYWIADPVADTVSMWRLTPTGYTLVKQQVPVNDLLAGEPKNWLHLEG